MNNEETITSESQAVPTDVAEAKPQPPQPQPQPGDAAYPDRILDIDPDKVGQRRRIFR